MRGTTHFRKLAVLDLLSCATATRCGRISRLRNRDNKFRFEWRYPPRRVAVRMERKNPAFHGDCFLVQGGLSRLAGRVIWCGVGACRTESRYAVAARARGSLPAGSLDILLVVGRCSCSCSSSRRRPWRGYPRSLLCPEDPNLPVAFLFRYSCLARVARWPLAPLCHLTCLWLGLCYIVHNLIHAVGRFPAKTGRRERLPLLSWNRA